MMKLSTRKPTLLGVDLALLTACVLLLAIAENGVRRADAFLDSVPERFRGGSMYRSMKQDHTNLMKLKSEYYNDTASIMKQVRNHSDTADGTFDQRYWIDLSAWDGGDLALLYISGEAPASRSPTGFAAEYGHKKSMALFTLEHRYYGKSMPSELTDTESLKRFLNVDAALDDLQNFQTFVEQTILGKPMRWIIVGGSYAGALSAWFKVKYPTKVIAAWSSSGVVEAQLNYYDYDGHMKEVLPPACQESAQYIVKKFDEMWDDPQGKKDFMNAMGMTGDFEKGGVAYMLGDAVAGAVQYGAKYSMCDLITPLNMDDPLGQYYNMIKELYGEDFTSDCGYSTSCLSDKSQSDKWAGSGYSWIFQCCSQLAYFQVGYPGALRSLAASTEYFVNQCRSVFGGNIFPDVYAFNSKWGGYYPNANYVIALQGSDDPWLPTGVHQDIGSNYPAVIAQCENCGHCGDLHGSQSSDPQSLKSQREQIEYYLNKWLDGSNVRYVLTLSGDFSDAGVTSKLLPMVERDLHDSFDHSSHVISGTELSDTTLVVHFSAYVHSLNKDILDANLKTISSGDAWMAHTHATYSEVSPKKPLSVVSVERETTPSAGATCGMFCVLFVIVGISALVAIGSVSILYMYHRKRVKTNMYLEVLNETY